MSNLALFSGILTVKKVRFILMIILAGSEIIHVSCQIKSKEKKRETKNSLLSDASFNSYERFGLSGLWSGPFYAGLAFRIKSLSS